MAVENEIPTANRTVVVDQAAFRAAPKVYSHQEALIESNNEMTMLLGTTSPFASNDSVSTFMPTTVVYMTLEHFRTFVGTLNDQLRAMDEASK